MIARREVRRGFQDYVFPLARRIKTIRVRYTQNLQITRGLLRPSRPAVAVCTFKHARQLIQPAMLQTGVSTLSSFEAHADIMFATASPGKYWAEWKTGRQQTGRQITRTTGPPSSPLGVNEGSAMHFCVCSTIPTTSRPPVLFFPFLIPVIMRFHHR